MRLPISAFSDLMMVAVNSSEIEDATHQGSLFLSRSRLSTISQHATDTGNSKTLSSSLPCGLPGEGLPLRPVGPVQGCEPLGLYGASLTGCDPQSG